MPIVRRLGRRARALKSCACGWCPSFAIHDSSANPFQEGLCGHRSDVSFPVAAHRNLAGLGLAAADDEHVRDLLELGLADLLLDGLGALVDLDAHAVRR